MDGIHDPAGAHAVSQRGERHAGRRQFAAQTVVRAVAQREYDGVVPGQDILIAVFVPRALR